MKNLREFIEKTVNEVLNENEEISKNKLYNDVTNFVNINNLNNLINSCDLSKGNCDTITNKLYNYLLTIGYDDDSLVEIELLNPKFDMDEAHPEWKKYESKYLVHTILKVGNFFIDLTGSQYSKYQSGIKIYSLKELSNLWSSYKIMKKDKQGKYIGGNYHKAKINKFN